MDFKYIILISIGVLFLIILLCMIFRKKAVYEKAESVMSDAENYFFYMVKDFLPKDYDIIPQVGLVNCFKIKRNERGALNRILSKRFDYAIVRHSRIKEFPHHIMDLVMAIELDDKSHSRQDRIERDKFVESTCYATDLPLLRYECKSNSRPNYDVERIESEIKATIKVFEKKR